MSNEAERFLKAREKLLEMNRKAQKATNFNRKHIYGNQNFLNSPRQIQNQKQKQQQQLSPRAQQQQEIQQKQTDYCFELTEIRNIS